MTAILKFVALTYAVTWSLWLAASLAPASAGLAPWLLLAGTLAPAPAGLWLAFRDGGKAALSGLAARLVAWRVGWGWYLFALLFMATIKLAAAGLHRLIEGAWPPFGPTGVGLMLLAVLISTPVQAGEEIGWRGFMLPRLAERIGYARAGLVVGVVWAVWHLPLFFIAGGDHAGQSFPVFLLGVTGLSVAIAWLYAHTRGSLLLTMLMHAAVNNTTGIVPATVKGGAGDVFGLNASTMGWLTTGLLLVCAAGFALTMPRAERAAARP